MRTLIKRLSVMAASVVAATAAMVASGVNAPASAAGPAPCPINHVCFYEYFHDNNGNPQRAGSMSDQTSQLMGHPKTITANVDQAFEYGTGSVQLDVFGSITDFSKNSHFTNGHLIDDKVSFVDNETDQCLMMWGNPGFQIPDGHLSEAVLFGPHTAKAMVGYNLGRDDNKFSSAAVTKQTAPSRCDAYASSGNYEWMTSPFNHHS
ncbi:hypothetical protein HH310_28720 [Actinoplanes sp. TBRC 11911]|uniref:hypothetical protein n=1 Tax=Actinoplanes sp. TBRC 11911 TaxID=2729386 RepID=UPI00145C9153|nr:hypothetical protein [Actinoplanes sp. TBRC 11911]NMO55157.1 hypothetical protein [Actinoplanes sp. TBRC 11911]